MCAYGEYVRVFRCYGCDEGSTKEHGIGNQGCHRIVTVICGKQQAKRLSVIRAKIWHDIYHIIIQIAQSVLNKLRHININTHNEQFAIYMAPIRLLLILSTFCYPKFYSKM